MVAMMLDLSLFVVRAVYARYDKTLPCGASQSRSIQAVRLLKRSSAVPAKLGGLAASGGGHPARDGRSAWRIPQDRPTLSKQSEPASHG
jgi:hypothetical protein